METIRVTPWHPAAKQGLLAALVTVLFLVALKSLPGILIVVGGLLGAPGIEATHAPTAPSHTRGWESFVGKLPTDGPHSERNEIPVRDLIVRRMTDSSLTPPGLSPR